MSARPIAVVGPSGAGKDTLMALASALPGIRSARRVITRPADAGGEEFTGVSEAEFAARATAGEFVLHWRAHGLGYGIPVSELAGEGVVLLNLSRAVLAEAGRVLPGLPVIEVTAPPGVLAARLAARGRESGADQAARLSRAGHALPEGLALRRVINDSTLEEGLARFLAALQPESA